MLRALMFCLVVAACSGASAQSYADFGIALRGEEGARAVLLKPRADADGAALVRLDRTNTELDGVVLPATYTRNGDRETYTVRYRGRNWGLVLVSDAYYGKSYTVSLPGRRDGTAMAYDADLSEAVVPAALLHERGEDAAAAEALGAFNRAREQALAQADIDEALALVERACGTRPAVDVDWASVSDDDILEYSIGSFAAPPLTALERLCRSDDTALSAAAKRVRRVSVTFGAPMTLTGGGDALAWATDGDAPNQDDFAYNVMLNVLRGDR